MNRPTQLLTLAVLMLGPSCATIYRPTLVPGQVARVKIVGPPDSRLASEGYRGKRTFDVAVHDHARGCPLVESTRTSKGFQGQIEVTREATTTVDVPTGQRLTFTSVPPQYVAAWPVVTIPCTSVISFVPAPGRTYVIRFPEIPNRGKRACGVTAEIEGMPRKDREPELFAYPHVLRGAEVFQPGGLCALGAD